MAADHHKFVVDGSVRDRNTGQGGYRYGTRHTWHDSHRYPGVGAGNYLFIAAGEYERVTAFEAHHELAGSGVFDQDSVDGLLSHRPAVGDFGGIDHLDVRAQFG